MARYFQFVAGNPVSTVLFHPAICPMGPYDSGERYQWLVRTADQVRQESNGRITLRFDEQSLRDGFIYIMANNVIPSSYTAEKAFDEVFKILKDATEQH